MVWGDVYSISTPSNLCITCAINIVTVTTSAYTHRLPSTPELAWMLKKLGPYIWLFRREYDGILGYGQCWCAYSGLTMMRHKEAQWWQVCFGLWETKVCQQEECPRNVNMKEYLLFEHVRDTIPHYFPREGVYWQRCIQSVCIGGNFYYRVLLYQHSQFVNLPIYSIIYRRSCHPPPWSIYSIIFCGSTLFLPR